MQDTVVVVVHLESLMLEVDAEPIVEERGIDANSSKSNSIQNEHSSMDGKIYIDSIRYRP